MGKKKKGNKLKKIIMSENGTKIIEYKTPNIFDTFELFVEKIEEKHSLKNKVKKSSNLNIRSKFIYYDEYDEPASRKINLNKKIAFCLILDLIKFIITGKI